MKTIRYESPEQLRTAGLQVGDEVIIPCSWLPSESDFFYPFMAREWPDRDFVDILIHEQYFYPDYKAYQPEFEEKLTATFEFLTEHGFESRFFEDLQSSSWAIES